MHNANVGGQKAPSAKRCIKTCGCSAAKTGSPVSVRKHRAPKGALRQVTLCSEANAKIVSESTERQKVH